MPVKAVRRPKAPPPIPREYSGKWVALDRSRSRVVASGRSFQEVFEAAKETREADLAYLRVPEADVRFVGGTP